MEPVIHFSDRPDVLESPAVMGYALCKAGKGTGTEGWQFVLGDWAHVTCKNCQRIVRAMNKREDAEEAKRNGQDQHESEARRDRRDRVA